MFQKYKASLFFGMFLIVMNCVNILWVLPDHLSHKHNLFLIFIVSAIGGIIGGFLYHYLFKLFTGWKAKKAQQDL